MLVLPAAFIILLFYGPVLLTFREAKYSGEPPWELPDQEVSYFLRDGVRGKMNIDGYFLVMDGYDAQCLFYQYLLDDEGQKVVRKYQDALIPGDKAIAFQQDVKNYIEEHYNIDVIESREYVKLYDIRSKK